MVSTHILRQREPADDGFDVMLLTSKKCPVSSTAVDLRLCVQWQTMELTAKRP